MICMHKILCFCLKNNNSVGLKISSATLDYKLNIYKRLTNIFFPLESVILLLTNRNRYIKSRLVGLRKRNQSPEVSRETQNIYEKFKGRNGIPYSNNRTRCREWILPINSRKPRRLPHIKLTVDCQTLESAEDSLTHRKRFHFLRRK